jgi:hypothetical protein
VLFLVLQIRIDIVTQCYPSFKAKLVCLFCFVTLKSPKPQHPRRTLGTDGKPPTRWAPCCTLGTKEMKSPLLHEHPAALLVLRKWKAPSSMSTLPHSWYWCKAASSMSTPAALLVLMQTHLLDEHPHRTLGTAWKTPLMRAPTMLLVLLESHLN